MKNIFFGSVLFFYSYVLFGEMHYPHPTSRFYLGSGFNPFDPDKAQLRCLEWDGVESSSGGRLQRSSIEISGVSSMS